jgi:prepilin signal peptidase PulO-like enzyme (type II secretory pathway)
MGVTLWWLCFATAAGLCLGSFLNVIIYRIPRDLSLRAPMWSACPHCGHRIRLRDNIPLLSFLLLRGKCRDCHAPIATRYVVVEALTAIIVLVLIDAFFIGQTRGGFRPVSVGLNDHLADNWPILLAHAILFACLLSMSIIDLEHYWVDVRFTNLATVCGFALHALWTPSDSMAGGARTSGWIRPWDATAVMAIFAMIGLGLAWMVLICRPQIDPEDFGDPVGGFDDAEAEDDLRDPFLMQAGESEAMGTGGSRWMGWLTAAILLGLGVSVFEAAGSNVGGTGGHAVRGGVVLVFFFVLIVSEMWRIRPADTQVVEEIDRERFSARRMVLDELVLLTPAIVLGGLGCWLFLSNEGVASRMSEVLHARVRLGDYSMMRTWQPWYGLATAASGFVIAGAIGWAVRIGFTLVFGREAFGAGDIHLMAATGAVAGWPVVLMGFTLSCLLALVGWVSALPAKRSRAIPLGPWLSLSFLAVVLFYDSVLRWPVVARVVDLAEMLTSRNSQPW